MHVETPDGVVHLSRRSGAQAMGRLARWWPLPIVRHAGGPADFGLTFQVGRREMWCTRYALPPLPEGELEMTLRDVLEATRESLVRLAGEGQRGALMPCPFIQPTGEGQVRTGVAVFSSDQPDVGGDAGASAPLRDRFVRTFSTSESGAVLPAFEQIERLPRLSVGVIKLEWALVDGVPLLLVGEEVRGSLEAEVEATLSRWSRRGVMHVPWATVVPRSMSEAEIRALMLAEVRKDNDALVAATATPSEDALPVVAADAPDDADEPATDAGEAGEAEGREAAAAEPAVAGEAAEADAGAAVVAAGEPDEADAAPETVAAAAAGEPDEADAAPETDAAVAAGEPDEADAAPETVAAAAADAPQAGEAAADAGTPVDADASAEAVAAETPAIADERAGDVATTEVEPAPPAPAARLPEAAHAPGERSPLPIGRPTQPLFAIRLPERSGPVLELDDDDEVPIVAVVGGSLPAFRVSQAAAGAPAVDRGEPEEVSLDTLELGEDSEAELKSKLGQSATFFASDMTPAEGEEAAAPAAVAGDAAAASPPRGAEAADAQSASAGEREAPEADLAALRSHLARLADNPLGRLLRVDPDAVHAELIAAALETCVRAGRFDAIPAAFGPASGLTQVMGGVAGVQQLVRHGDAGTCAVAVRAGSGFDPRELRALAPVMRAGCSHLVVVTLVAPPVGDTGWHPLTLHDLLPMMQAAMAHSPNPDFFRAHAAAAVELLHVVRAVRVLAEQDARELREPLRAAGLLTLCRRQLALDAMDRVDRRLEPDVWPRLVRGPLSAPEPPSAQALAIQLDQEGPDPAVRVCAVDPRRPVIWGVRLAGGRARLFVAPHAVARSGVDAPPDPDARDALLARICQLIGADPGEIRGAGDERWIGLGRFDWLHGPTRREMTQTCVETVWVLWTHLAGDLPTN